MKKILLGLGTFASVAAPVAVAISCGNSENNITWNISTADTIEKMAVVFKANLNKMNNIDSYDTVEFKVVDGDRNFDYKIRQRKEDAAALKLYKKFNAGLVAFMNVSLKARGYTQGYPSFINNYVSGDGVK